MSQPNAICFAVPGGTAIAVSAFLPLFSCPDCNSASVVTVGSVVKKFSSSSDSSSTSVCPLTTAFGVHWVPSALTLSAPQLPGPQMCWPTS